VYEKKFQNPTELDLKLLTRGYLLTGNVEKTLDASREFLKKNPHSFQALTSLAYYYAKSGNSSRLNQTLRKLVSFHGDQRELLTILAAVVQPESEKKFLEQLKTAYTRFLKTYRERPESAMEFLDFKPAPSRWNALREIIRINCTNLLLRAHLSAERFEPAEKLIVSNIERIGEFSRKSPGAFLLARQLANLAKNALPYYLNLERFGDVHEFCNEARDILKRFDPETNYVHLHDCVGYVSLQQSRALVLEGRTARAKDLLFLAGEAYDRALESLETLPPAFQDELLRNAGLSYAWKGEIYRDNRKNILAKVYFKQALRLFERALEMDPLYSGEIALQRQKLLEFTAALPS
jgi:tetratricopeptide (TPR) repeat protein